MRQSSVDWQLFKMSWQRVSMLVVSLCFLSLPQVLLAGERWINLWKWRGWKNPICLLFLVLSWVKGAYVYVRKGWAFTSTSCLSSVLSYSEVTTSYARGCFYTSAPENFQPTLQKENKHLAYREGHPTLRENAAGQLMRAVPCLWGDTYARSSSAGLLNASSFVLYSFICCASDS